MQKQTLCYRNYATQFGCDLIANKGFDDNRLKTFMNYVVNRLAYLNKYDRKRLCEVASQYGNEYDESIKEFIPAGEYKPEDYSKILTEYTYQAYKFKEYYTQELNEIYGMPDPDCPKYYQYDLHWTGEIIYAIGLSDKLRHLWTKEENILYDKTVTFLFNSYIQYDKDYIEREKLAKYKVVKEYAEMQKNQQELRKTIDIFPNSDDLPDLPLY